MPTVIHHQRLPDKGHYSIERLFEAIRHEISPKWSTDVSVSPYASRGIWPRLKNLSAASKLHADVHHIVGDVHYLAPRLPPENLVLTIHDCAALGRLRGWRREALRRLWFQQPIEHASVVTTISDTTKRELKKWIGSLADKVKVIPNCVRSEFRPDLKEFDNDCPVILQVGTGWNKNIIGVARALIGIPCRLEIIGSLDERQRDALKASHVNYVELGQVSDDELVQAYRRCDLLVFASLYEGFGMPILEAQATGRPVLTSNLSSMPEAAGDGALFVNPSDPQAIRHAVKRIIEDASLRKELIHNGFQNADRFQPAQVARSYESVYESLIQ